MVDEVDAEFRHPRLVQVYDIECPWSRDDEYFLSELRARRVGRVVDLGCGTGRLATGLAERGFSVTGVDPAPASLRAARGRPGAERVTWIEGDGGAVPMAEFDAALMTSHVAQFLVSDEALAAALLDLRRGCVTGAVLMFDSRDPEARAWEAWTPERSRRAYRLPDGTGVEVFTEVVEDQDEQVSFVHHYAFSDGERLESASTLRFRTEACLRRLLEESGWAVERIDGGWRGEPVGEGDGELLVVALAEP